MRSLPTCGAIGCAKMGCRFSVGRHVLFLMNGDREASAAYGVCNESYLDCTRGKGADGTSETMERTYKYTKYIRTTAENIGVGARGGGSIARSG